MKSKILILGIFIILLSSFVSAIDVSNNILYYSIDNADRSGNTIIDLSQSLLNGTNNGGTLGVVGLLNEAVNNTVNSQYIETPDNALIDNIGDLTINLWYKGTDTSATADLMIKGTTGDYQQGLVSTTGGELDCTVWTTTGSAVAFARTVGQASTIANGNWHMLSCVVYNGVKTEIYIDGSLVATSSSWSGTYNIEGARPWRIGMGEGRAGKVGLIDEVSLWNKTLNSSEFSELYLGGIGFNPYASNVYNFSITAKSYWDNSSINNFNVSINGTIYSTTNGTIITPILDNSTSLFNITVFSTGWFNKTYEDYNVSSNLAAVLTQSDISFACFEKVSGNELNCTNSTIYPDAGDYNFTISSAGYYDMITEQTINALDNKTINVSGFYSSNVTLDTSFAVGGGSTACNYTITGITYPSFYELVTSNVTDASVGIINGTYNVTADCDGYASSWQNVTIENTTQTVSFMLYTTNSLQINIYDEITRNLVTDTIILNFISDVQSVVGNTSNGTYYVDLLSPSDYELRYYGDDYKLRSYFVSVPDDSYQNVSIYALKNTYTENQSLSIIVQDFTLSAAIGYRVKLLRYYPDLNDYLFVAMADVNTNGVATFYVDRVNNAYYKILVEKDGVTAYESKAEMITTSQYYITINSLNIFQKYATTLEGDLTLVNTTSPGYFRFTYNNKDSIIDTLTLKVDYDEKFNTGNVCTKTSTAVSGSLICDLPENATYSAVVYADFSDGRTEAIDDGYATDSTGLPWGEFGVLMALIITLVAFLGALYWGDLKIAILVLDGLLAIFIFVPFIHMSWYVLGFVIPSSVWVLKNLGDPYK